MFKKIFKTVKKFVNALNDFVNEMWRITFGKKARSC